MKRTTCAFCLLVFCLIVACTPLKAQDYLFAAGNPSFSVNIPVEHGFINITNGNLHLEFPIANHPQRGNLKLNERLVYDSRIWMIGHYSNSYWWPTGVYGAPYTQDGWRFVTGNDVGSGVTWSYGSYELISDGCPVPPYYGQHTRTTSINPSWTDPTGTTHIFNASYVSDQDDCTGSYVGYINSGYATDGSGYALTDGGNGQPVISDNNGNEVYPQVTDRYGNYWSSDANGNLIDDTGRTPVIKTVNGNVTYYDVLSPNGPINNNGLRVRYTVTTTNIAVSTQFNQPQVREWPDGGSNILSPIQSIQLPDGTSYSFTYDSYGEMTSMTLPTGGIVQFGWSNYFDSYQNGNRWLTSYKLGNNPATTFGQQVLTFCASNGTGCKEQVTLHKPSGDETVYELTLDDIGAWNTNIAAYTGSATGTPILRTVNTYTPGPDYKTKSLSTTTLSNGLNTQTQYDYDSPWTGKPTSIKQWDYYSGSPSPSPSRETDYTYSYADLQQVTLKENGNQISQTTYAYTSTATATSGVPHHGTAIMPTPYLQSVTQWLNTGGASPVTNYTMDDTGMVTQVLDPNGHASSTNYQCSNSLPYQSTNALGHVTTYGYDCNSGAITSVKDPNDLANGRAGITYQYEAGAGRLQSISYPDGGQKTYSYPSAIEVDTAVIANPDPTINSQDIVDAFGRPSQHVQAGTSTETSYDVNGRVSSVTNPHYSTPSSTDGTTHINSYDGLDRPLTKTQPDNTTLSWSYPGNTVISTDEAGHQWQRTSDAFGRLTKVIEPNNAETDYAYNGFTTTVSQKGVVGVESARPDRIFTTDSLGRTVSVNAPENGTTTYGYDANGNLTLKVDPRGSDVHYDYDALNRLLNITYGWQPCPNRHFIYDQSTGWSGTQMNTIGRLSSAYTDPGSFPVQDYSRSDELFSYDAMGRTIRIASAFPSEAGHAAHELRAAYDLAGDMIRLTYPDGRVVNQSYDGASNLQSVVFDNWNGQHVGYSYVSAASYWPDGSPHTMTLGNGVVQTFDKNNRGQLAGISANAIGPALNATLFAKQFGYTSQTQSANNGNIMQATDLLKANRSQSFGYDQLNRLTSFSTQDATLAQTYSIDSFGNLKQAGTQNFQPIYTTGNRIQDGFGYDGNGNVNTIANPGGGTSYYSFDADDRFSVFNFADYYTYSALGDRVRKDVDNIYTEYQYFNGQVIAERGQDGNWTDYIYANGRKIARADSYDVRIHFTGTTCANCGQQYSQYNFPIASYTIQAGDKIAWRQYQQGAAIPEGGLALAFSDGSFTNWVTTDQDGQTMNADTTENAWHYRVADLSQHAGKTIIAGWINANAFGGSGNWEEWFSDIVFIRTDGTVVPIYHRQPNVSYTFSASSGITNPTFEINTAPNLGWEPKNNTTYYIADQVGSTQMTLTGGGWPISTTTFYPFGQEASTNSDPNHYRFASLERDGESGLDHATFRDYSSTQGRWMSPDPYLGSYDFANPQSFNRYSYVGNMPLIAIDPSGLSFEYDPVNGCWDDWDVSTNSLTLSGCTNSVPINGVNTGGGVGAGSGSSGGGGSHGNRSSKVNIANCASSFAQKTSIAGGLNNLGIGNKGGVGGFLTNALGGNAVSGIIDLFRNGGSLTDIAFSGTRLGMPGASDRLEKGISGVVQDATAAGFHSVISTGGELTTLTGTASTVGLTAGEYATGVGELKFGYDALTYLGATAGCALNIIR